MGRTKRVIKIYIVDVVLVVVLCMCVCVCVIRPQDINLSQSIFLMIKFVFSSLFCR